MTVPSEQTSSWSDLSPWDKAAQWHEKAPHISEKIMTLAEEQTRNLWEFKVAREQHRQMMEVRTWWTQIVVLTMGLCNVAILAVVAWHYADTGNVVPGLTIFGAGAGLTAGAYGVGRWIARNQSSSQGTAHRASSDGAQGGE